MVETFQDADIINELNDDPIIKSKLISKSRCFTSDWYRHHSVNTPHWLRAYGRTDRRGFPDSVTTGMRLLHERILKDNLSNYTFYIAGVSLKWMDPSHFWKGMDHKALNNKDHDWYKIRFYKMLGNFKKLQGLGFKMISVTPDSNLNKIMRNESINNLYVN